MTDNEIVLRIIEDEGGDKFTFNPADPGGATKFGITIPALTDLWKSLGVDHDPTADDIQALTHEGAVSYYLWSLKASKIGQIINPMVRYVVFDAAVHMGVKQAVRLLQRALSVDDDGVLGPVTLAATPYLNSDKLCRLFAVEQMLFYGRLAAKNLTDADKDGTPDQLEFLPGYLNRLARKMRALA